MKAGDDKKVTFCAWCPDPHNPSPEHHENGAPHHRLLRAHQYKTSADCTHDPYQHAPCWVCEGGLSICKVCGLYEGSLTTECPGYECYAEKGDDVYAGKIDFRDGQWVEGKSPYTPKELPL
jgi:hypothetical protein